MAKLARHTGWSILDVEEVHDIFHRYARNGSINTTCNEFKFLVLEICSDTTEAEMRAMFRDIRKVRRSSLQWHKRFSQVTNAYSNGNPSALKAAVSEQRRILKFSEFFIALTRWLDEKDSSMRASRTGRPPRHERCTLTRYTMARKENAGKKEQPPPPPMPVLVTGIEKEPAKVKVKGPMSRKHLVDFFARRLADAGLAGENDDEALDSVDDFGKELDDEDEPDEDAALNDFDSDGDDNEEDFAALDVGSRLQRRKSLI
mmetsp:Transcript_56903/g.164909  ORF Transcript_56903/g.164909 Transcript_56903/m.164909 type:complete len:259 (-) Transcript_56903:28-804(-)